MTSAAHVWRQRLPPASVWFLALAGFGAVVVLVAWGYGKYVGVASPMFFLLFIFLSVVSACTRRVPVAVTAGLVLVAFLGGRFAGYQTRLMLCRGVQQRVAPVIEALDRYRATHGIYPISLAEVPEVKGIKASIREGKGTEGRVEVSGLADEEATFVLAADRYLCVIPIEWPYPISITGFHVYAFSSDAPQWKEDYWIWMYRGPLNAMVVKP